MRSETRSARSGRECWLCVNGEVWRARRGRHSRIRLWRPAGTAGSNGTPTIPVERSLQARPCSLARCPRSADSLGAGLARSYAGRSLVCSARVGFVTGGVCGCPAARTRARRSQRSGGASLAVRGGAGSIRSGLSRRCTWAVALWSCGCESRCAGLGVLALGFAVTTRWRCTPPHVTPCESVPLAPGGVLARVAASPWSGRAEPVRGAGRGGLRERLGSCNGAGVVPDLRSSQTTWR